MLNMLLAFPRFSARSLLLSTSTLAFHIVYKCFLGEYQ